VPGGGRFVGNAMAKNMFPVFIPCHRVIKSDGAMGYYSGGVHIKEFLLAHELGNKK
jgi:methylated-DNA-[protein]-cysteine S-methyltransferase